MTHKPIYTKTDYLTNSELTSFPWTVSPFAESILENDNTLSDADRELCLKYIRDGYVIINLDIDDAFCDELVDSLDNCPTGSYFYNPETVRYFEAWKYSKHVRALAANKKIIDTLRLLYRREPIPFQTINFIDASEQDVHSDTLHFHTVPNHWMCGVWVPLEDMDECDGTLQYVRGSHKLPVTEFHTLNMNPPEYSHDADGPEQKKYDTYEEYVKALIEASNLPVEKYIGPPGVAIIWQANLLHGGTELKDRTRTRKAQATHYYFKDMPGPENIKKYYCPMYSCEPSGDYSLKDLSAKDILGLYKED